MKIHSIILENFRCFYGRVEIPIDDFTVFIGKNDQGKSTILEAIDIFINEGKGAVKIEENDLNRKAKNEGEEIFRIGMVFKDLPENVVIDATNPTILKDEYLLNSDGYLEICKTFKRGKIVETFLRCYHPANDNFIKDLMKKKVGELQDFIKKNKIDMPNLDQRKSADLRKAIRDYYNKKYGKLKLELIEIKIDEEGVKEIWSKLREYLPVYALFHSDRKNTDQDEEIQDPLKVKVEQIFKRDYIQRKLIEIGEEIDKELQEFAETIIQKFQELTNKSLPINISPNIPEVASLKWKDVYKGIGLNTDDDIPLNKRGSGIRRIVLVSSFLAEIEMKNTSSDNHIVYAIEEPETSLHPDLQRKLISALKELTEKGTYQVLLSTHSPALIRLFETSSIRYVEQFNGDAKVEKFDENNKDLINKIVKTLGLLPNIAKVIICVEGTYDENFLLNINQNIPELKQIIDLKSKIESGLVAIIPMRGSHLQNWIDKYVLKNTNAIEFHLYDRDSDSKYKKDIEKVNNRQDGSYGCLTKKREIENYIPKEIIESEFKITLDNINEKNWDNEDIPKKILEKISNKMSEERIKEKLCNSCSKKITKEHLEKLNAWDEVESWFKKIKEMTDRTFNNG